MDVAIHNIVKIEQHLQVFTAAETRAGERFCVLTLYTTDTHGRTDEIKLFAANSDLLVFSERP